MASIADYLVLQAGSFALKGNSHVFAESHHIVTSTPLSGDTVTSPTLRSPILSFTADASQSNVTLSVKVNGHPIGQNDFVAFTEGQPCAFHFVLDGQNIHVGQTNSFEFAASNGTGLVTVRDVVLWFQREFPQLGA